ncbi:site-specific integrase [Eremococcus coleocola]|uniref:site-specific integrase n=1 Tax=Eremococcus coleocola TaxID=88132 RepID=UPI000417D4BB|nr:site-specific integrase [Eremococcus coleocola]
MIKKYTKKDGSTAYKFVAYLGIDPLTGKQKRTTRQGFKTKKEAQLAESRLKLEIDKSGFSSAKKLTFSQVYNLWLVEHHNTVKPGTYATTKRYARLHILPRIGNTKVDRLNVVNCQKLVNEWAKTFNSAKYPKGITQQVLDYAVKMQLITDNPMRKVKLPNRKEMPDNQENYYNSEELSKFFECVADYGNQKFLSFFRILAFTGMRKGEALALTWGDIDFNAKTITVSKGVSLDEAGNPIITTPKTKNSMRVLSVDAQTLNILKKWRTLQLTQLMKKGINGLDSSQLLFTFGNNRVYRPSYTNGWLITIINKYNLKYITMHGFRHSHCSLLFEMGTPIQVVQERLGHSNIKTTMDIYTHVTEKARDQIADNFAKYVNF